MTEQDAKTKWCPFARSFAHNQDGAAGLNRLSADAMCDELPTCLGTTCMAWRGTPDDGYCGLAGVPTNAQP